MNKNRRLALFGASGGTGVHLIPLLLQRGFGVRAMVRDPASISLRRERLEVLQGDLMDPTCTAGAIAGTDGVISLAGPRRLGPTHIYSEGGRNVVRGMEAAGVRRGVFVTALGTSKEFRMPPVLGFLARHVVGWFLRHGWSDGARFEEELAMTNLEWTVIRPPALNHLAPRGRYRRGIGEHLRSPFRLSRADLAHAVLDQLDDPATVRRWVEVAW
jgi:putative NADH-flavin reductase